jgi:hypothetical protein
MNYKYKLVGQFYQIHYFTDEQVIHIMKKRNLSGAQSDRQQGLLIRDLFHFFLYLNPRLSIPSAFGLLLPYAVIP